MILISNALNQLEALQEAAVDDAEVVVYEAQSDSLGSITEELSALVDSTGQKIGHLAILSHGAPGTLILGDQEIFSATSLAEDSAAWQGISSLLAEEARIDLYGCAIGYGDDGESLVLALSEITDSVVWASDDNTGAEDLSGDWDLETRSAPDERRPLLATSDLANEFNSLLGFFDWDPYDLIVMSNGDL